MKICQLFSIFSDYRLGDRPQSEVTSLVTDSRQVGPGSVFIAIRGLRSDGHNFLAEVVKRGAAALVVEDISQIPEGFTGAVVKVASTRRILGKLAERYWGAPSSDLFLAAVTGTNGKTSTTYLIEHLLTNFGWPTGVMGTINHHLGDKVWPSALTTPDTLEFFQRLEDFRAQGARSVAFEISSHALDQRRIDLLDVDVAVFTNLSRDHLDYHGTMEAYLEAKSRLFTEILKSSQKTHRLAVLFGDDPAYPKVAAACDGLPVWTYGKKSFCDLRYEISESGVHGSRFELFTAQGQQNFFLPLIGPHNVANATAAIGVALFAGASLESLAAALQNFPGVPGRLQRVASRDTKTVLVDFAHTEEALLSTLSAVREVMESHQKLWVLFGCGGDRDKGKRPAMGHVAVTTADQVVLTSDNPRSEDPEKILAEILSGVSAQHRDKVVQVEPDRRLAIGGAIEQMGPEDVLVIAGKGHEEFQILGGKTLPMSDYQMAQEKLI